MLSWQMLKGPEWIQNADPWTSCIGAEAAEN